MTTKAAHEKKVSRPFILREKAWLRGFERTADIQKNPKRTFPVLFDTIAGRLGDQPALLSATGSMSYSELSGQINRYARWGLSRGLSGGRTAGLLMENCIDYPAIWLGLSKIGATVALLNTNLSSQALAHSISAAGASLVIASASLLPVLEAASEFCEVAPEIVVAGGGTSASFDAQVRLYPGTPLTEDEAGPVTLANRALCIFTSGTTGLPKAANVSHHRIMSWTHWFAGLMDVRADDRLYNCLPFYHSIGGVAALGALLCGGGSVFVREKFSARNFWPEVSAHGCTIFQYIGELCRYLLNAPPSPFETGHALRLCCGNGLGGDIWEPFKTRFQIPHILEFYAATEANFSLYNVDEMPGSLGRIPSFLAHRFPIKLIKIDPDSLEPLRGEDGLCIVAGADEPGEGLFPIAPDTKSGASSFEGYTNSGESERKILRNVLSRGDAWYRSGDLFKRQPNGFFYFVDRLGDTFRWKGENVSAQEVAQAISSFPGIKEATVYGVALPGCEGRAGMAAISTGPDFTIDGFKPHLDKTLPHYAQPLFLRIMGELEMTPTFRPKKSGLAAEGFDPRAIPEQLYFNNHETKTFEVLTAGLYGLILSGGIKL